MNQRWEYAIVEWIWNQEQIQYFFPDGRQSTLQGSYAEVVDLLTSFGREGWEVICSSAAGNWLLWTLKRAIS